MLTPRVLPLQVRHPSGTVYTRKMRYVYPWRSMTVGSHFDVRQFDPAACIRARKEAYKYAKKHGWRVRTYKTVDDLGQPVTRIERVE